MSHSQEFSIDLASIPLLFLRNHMVPPSTELLYANVPKRKILLASTPLENGEKTLNREQVVARLIERKMEPLDAWFFNYYMRRRAFPRGWWRRAEGRFVYFIGRSEIIRREDNLPIILSFTYQNGWYSLPTMGEGKFGPTDWFAVLDRRDAL